MPPSVSAVTRAVGVVAAGLGALVLVAAGLGALATQLVPARAALTVTLVVGAVAALIGGFLAEPALHRLARPRPAIRADPRSRPTDDAGSAR